MKKNAISWAHPLIQQWFLTQLGEPTEPQIQGWPAILARKNTLISAPTGSGKTLAAFLACLNDLVCQALSGDLKDETEVIYVSPLKALSNDVQKNLLQPLLEIQKLTKQKNLKMAEVRVAVRTGDTLAKERQSMLKKPPHILVTTPESFYILLTAEKSRAMLQSVKTVIIDEIHALADDKRGAHLAISLERLAALTKIVPMRIGLSATQKPLELVAKFLVGNRRAQPVQINIGHQRQLELAIEVPKSELSSVASHEMWDEIYDRLAQLTEENRSTLVFVNTRRLAERVAHHLSERLGEDQVAAHHGSLSRKIRLNAENKLKNGELKILVATASLELGIDIGAIDLVCQIGSPRSINTGLQRVGRAGHWHGAISKGRFFVTTREELIECAALIYAIHTGDLDELHIPETPLDILAQQIVAMCATEDWDESNLFKLIKKAYPYGNLTQESFNQIIQMLSEGVAGTRGRYGALLFRDSINEKVKARRGSRLIAIMNGGAIPDNGLFTVIAEPDGTMVGTLDEDFAVESNRGDIILLGSTSWQVRRVESVSGRVIVENAHGAPPSVPFWRGEAPARTKELSMQVSNLRNKINELLENFQPPFFDIKNTAKIKHAIQWVNENCGLDDAGSEQILDYILQGRALLGTVPTQSTIIAERFFDEAGGMQLIIHSPLGARINKAWGLALRKRFCRSFNFELQAAATDNGINISLTEQHSFPLADVFHFLHPNSLKEVLVQAVLQSPLFKTRWRWDATRSLALTRFRFGKKVPPNIQRILADDLLAAVFPDAAACQDNLAGKDIELPDHPLIQETMKDALTEALDIDGLIEVIQNILNQKITCLAIDTPVPSVFAHEILNANPYAYLDDAPLEERRARAVEMRRSLPETVLETLGKLDPEAILSVQEQIWPDIRNADELHDFLQTVIAFSVDAALSGKPLVTKEWEIFSAELLQQNRLVIGQEKNKFYWIAKEKLAAMAATYPAINFPNGSSIAISQSDNIESILRGWLLFTGPITATELNHLLNIDIDLINENLIKLETSGFVLRGHFRFTKEIEWCERRILARIHRLTLGSLRKKIQPVTALQFMKWLTRWQHIAPGSQLFGEQGLLEVIKQLQGYDIPANAWENILAKRIKNYDKTMLDQLCLSGTIGWGRSVSPSTKRVFPNSIVPITFFLRDDSKWIHHIKLEDSEANKLNLSATANTIYQYLQQKGACFFIDIVKGTGKLNAEIEYGLWELVSAGLITADGFDNLRALIDRKRRLDNKKRKFAARHSPGRWTLLPNDIVNPDERVEACCWMLLNRYGIVFRDLLAREKNIPTWRELLNVFRRLESRGEIRGGRFVDGFLGEQFALIYAVDSVRAIKHEIIEDEIKISAVDPLNLSGIILPGERVPANSGKEWTIHTNHST